MTDFYKQIKTYSKYALQQMVKFTQMDINNFQKRVSSSDTYLPMEAKMFGETLENYVIKKNIELKKRKDAVLSELKKFDTNPGATSM